MAWVLLFLTFLFNVCARMVFKVRIIVVSFIFKMMALIHLFENMRISIVLLIDALDLFKLV